jgi:AcrR family transcriptional regulator
MANARRKTRSLAPTPPEPTRRDSVEIVDAVVSAAMELGDPDASVNAIAARAGVGVASMYRYFPSKGAVYAEVSRRLQRDFLKRLRSLLETPHASLEEAVAACCRIAVMVPGVNAALRKSLNLAVPQSWVQETAVAIFSSAVAEMTQWIEARLERPPADLRHRVFVAFAASRGMVIMAQLLPDLAPSDEVLIEQMTRGAVVHLQPLGTLLATPRVAQRAETEAGSVRP